MGLPVSLGQKDPRRRLGRPSFGTGPSRAVAGNA